MERILLVADYPILYGPGLCGIEEETAEHLFTSMKCNLTYYKLFLIIKND
jgi:hypothetical protein